jgi:holo-[acyl-carrier protein] synthase
VAPAAVIGVGIDSVELDRFRAVLARTPHIVERLFTDGERVTATTHRDPTARFAARFAVKEALMKALGVGLGSLDFHDVEVVRADSGAPSLSVRGRAAALAAERGVRDWLVSITHTEHTATAIVISVG